MLIMGSDAAQLVLSYRRPLPRARLGPRLLRWGMLTVAVLVFAAGVIALFNPVLELREWLGGGTLGTPAAPITEQTENNLKVVYVSQAAGYLAVFLLSQWLFLVPRGRWRLSSLGGGPLTARSAAAAGFVAMLLS